MTLKVGEKPKTMGIEIATQTILGEIKNNHSYFRFYRRDKFTPRFPVYVNEDGVCQELDVQDAKAIIISISNIKFIENHANIGSFGFSYKNVDILCMTEANAGSVLKTLSLKKDLMIKDKIKPFAFKSDPSLTFCRLPFDPIVDAVMPPIWQDFLGNMTNADAICMWLGSLFFDDSDRSQYVWIYGKGGNGKTTLARVVSKLLGNFVLFSQVPANENPFWTSGFLHKRLIVLDDCNNYGFPKTGLFKSLTGNGKVSIEKKFCAAYDTDLDCKFLFTSNAKPTISSDLSDMRRIIFSSTKNESSYAYDSTFEDRLFDALPEFISVCMAMYKKTCGDGRPIPVDNAETLALADFFDEEVESWLEANGEFTSSGFVTTAAFSEIILKTKFNRIKVYEYLKKRGVMRKGKKIGGSRIPTKVLCGYRLKSFAEKVGDESLSTGIDTDDSSELF